MFFKSIYF